MIGSILGALLNRFQDRLYARDARKSPINMARVCLFLSWTGSTLSDECNSQSRDYMARALELWASRLRSSCM